MAAYAFHQSKYVSSSVKFHNRPLAKVSSLHTCPGVLPHAKGIPRENTEKMSFSQRSHWARRLDKGSLMQEIKRKKAQIL